MMHCNNRAIPSGGTAAHYDDVTCYGDEATITQCIKSEFGGVHNCRHTEDAGVRCYG